MLVPAMNRQELYAQVAKENNKLCETTMQRLADDYDRERKKLKIKKESDYFKDYQIKTGGKNTWFIFFHKCPSKEIYTGKDCISFLNVVYYYDKIGLKVLYVDENQTMSTYSGHFFKRYNERLGLNISNPLEIVKVFFKNCGYAHANVIEKKNKLYLFGVVKDGLILGDYHQDPITTEWKTFISRDLKRVDQEEQEKSIIESLQMDVIKARQKDNYRQDVVEQSKTIYAALTGKFIA